MMVSDSDIDFDEALCVAIRAALMLADRCGNTLAAALLDEAHEAARCTGRADGPMAQT